AATQFVRPRASPVAAGPFRPHLSCLLPQSRGFSSAPHGRTESTSWFALAYWKLAPPTRRAGGLLQGAAPPRASPPASGDAPPPGSPDHSKAAAAPVLLQAVRDFDTKRTFSIKEKFVAEAEENLDVLDL
ncbi:unnamed protein product, partial [Urochloa humidicola]